MLSKNHPTTYNLHMINWSNPDNVFSFRAIAEIFRVKESTVRCWRSRHPHLFNKGAIKNITRRQEGKRYVIRRITYFDMSTIHALLKFKGVSELKLPPYNRKWFGHYHARYGFEYVFYDEINFQDPTSTDFAESPNHEGRLYHVAYNFEYQPRIKPERRPLVSLLSDSVANILQYRTPRRSRRLFPAPLAKLPPAPQPLPA